MPQLVHRPVRSRFTRPAADLGFPWARPLLAELFDWDRESLTTSWVPIDMKRTPHAVIVTASVPGIDPDNIELTVDRGMLTIAGRSAEEESNENDSYVLQERRIGSFERSIRLPRGIESSQASSDYINGELVVTVPLVENHKPQRIKVNH